MRTHVFVSPHFDDVVGSCAGIIQRLRAAGHEVRILTVFGGRERPPFSEVASSMHREWELQDVVVARRCEDEMACAVLDATSGSCDLPDSIYRMDDSGRHLYRTFPALIGAVDKADRELPKRIAERLDPIVPAADVVVYSPAAVGNHVDHVLTRRAVEMLRPGHMPIIYYREFFYEQFGDTPLLPGSRILKVTLEPREVELKITAFAAYRSQIKSLFGDEKGLHRYFRTRGTVEGLFIPKDVPPALYNELVDVMRARIVSWRLQKTVQALTAPLRRQRAAAILNAGAPMAGKPGVRLRRLISRMIRFLNGAMHRRSSRAK